MVAKDRCRHRRQHHSKPCWGIPFFSFSWITLFLHLNTLFYKCIDTFVNYTGDLESYLFSAHLPNHNCSIRKRQKESYQSDQTAMSVFEIPLNMSMLGSRQWRKLYWKGTGIATKKVKWQSITYYCMNLPFGIWSPYKIPYF